MKLLKSILDYLNLYLVVSKLKNDKRDLQSKFIHMEKSRDLWKEKYMNLKYKKEPN